jgi:hypothetical protein
VEGKGENGSNNKWPSNGNLEMNKNCMRHGEMKIICWEEILILSKNNNKMKGALKLINYILPLNGQGTLLPKPHNFRL